MKIAVCGSGSATDKSVAEEAFKIGKEIALNSALLLTGSGNGYPYEAAKGAFSFGGKVFGVSPAKNEEEHLNSYSFPTENFSEIEYTGLGIPARNFTLVEKADAVIIISGQTGSLNEFTIALHYNKVIGILKGSGGVTDIIENVAEICNKNGEKDNIVYSSDPKELVEMVMRRFKQ